MLFPKHAARAVCTGRFVTHEARWHAKGREPRDPACARTYPLPKRTAWPKARKTSVYGHRDVSRETSPNLEAAQNSPRMQDEATYGPPLGPRTPRGSQDANSHGSHLRAPRPGVPRSKPDRRLPPAPPRSSGPRPPPLPSPTGERVNSPPPHRLRCPPHL